MVSSAKFGKGSLVLTNEHDKISLYEVIEPYVSSREQSEFDFNKWRMPTILISIFGVVFY